MGGNGPREPVFAPDLAARASRARGTTRYWWCSWCWEVLLVRLGSCPACRGLLGPASAVSIAPDPGAGRGGVGGAGRAEEATDSRRCFSAEMSEVILRYRIQLGRPTIQNPADLELLFLLPLPLPVPRDGLRQPEDASGSARHIAEPLLWRILDHSCASVV